MPNLVVDLLVERSNLSKIVKRLEKRELISVGPVKGDGRLRRLTCLPAGLKLFKRSERALVEWNGLWLEGLSNDGDRQPPAGRDKISVFQCGLCVSVWLAGLPCRGLEQSCAGVVAKFLSGTDIVE
jgi:hypothetical protein